jgi:hypothetical protein
VSDDSNPFDDPFDDPHVGPGHLPGPDFGGSITFDDAGHLRQLGVTIPGTAEGSDQLKYDFDHHDDTLPGPMPGSLGPDPLQPPSGLPSDDPLWMVPAPGDGDPDQPGDYPEPEPDPDYGVA